MFRRRYNYLKFMFVMFYLELDNEDVFFVKKGFLGRWKLVNYYEILFF